MKFIVSKKMQSISGDDRPCDEAVREELTPLDYRTVKTLEEAKKKIWYKDWLKGGVNHREENGRVVCEKTVKQQQWVVEIASLDELLKFQDKYGDIILRDSAPYVEVKKEIIIP